MLYSFTRKTNFHIAFSFAEQGITCLSALFKTVNFDISAAEIRQGRPVRDCDFLSLPRLSAEYGIALQQVHLTKIQNIKQLNVPIVVSLHDYGVVILERGLRDQLWMNNPSSGWQKVTNQAILSCLAVNYGYILPESQGSKFPQRHKPSFLFELILSEKSIFMLGLFIVIISTLHGFASLLDPVAKNLYFTNVVQMSMLEWARPIAIFYFLAAILSGTLLLLSL